MPGNSGDKPWPFFWMVKKKLHLSEEFFSVTSNHSGGDFLKVTAWQLGSFHPSGNNDRDFGALDLSVVFWKTSPVWFPSLATLPSLKSIKPATRHNFDLMLHGEFWRTFVMGIPKIIYIYIFPPSWQRVPRISYDFGLNFWTHLAYAKSILSSSSSCKTHHRQATMSSSRKVTIRGTIRCSRAQTLKQSLVSRLFYGGDPQRIAMVFAMSHHQTPGWLTDMIHKIIHQHFVCDAKKSIKYIYLLIIYDPMKSDECTNIHDQKNKHFLILPFTASAFVEKHHLRWCW